MQLPVDVKALLEEITDVKAEQDTPLAVSVYIDETAPADLAAHVRNAFASSNGHVRMTVSYIGETFIAHPTDDFAVIVAGDTGNAGKQAARVRAVGVPVMVATLNSRTLDSTPQDSEDAVPDGDVVSPWDDDEQGSGVFDEKAAAALDERMGKWIVSVCRSKKLAFAIAFPFMRRPLASDTVMVRALENAGIGLLPLPGADLPLITLNQAKMAMEIAAAYGQEMSRDRLKEIAVVIIGAYLSRSLVRKVISAVPVLGAIARPGVAYGATLAMGYALIEYFEGGEDATGVANVMERFAGVGAEAASFARDKVDKLGPLVSKVTSR